MKTASLILTALVFAKSLLAQHADYYGTAHTANETTYLTKPVYTTSNANAIYFSGRFSHTVFPYYDNERTYFGELSLHRSHTWKHINLSYGILGYGGSYRIHEVERYAGNKYFGGTGATGELNFNLPFKKVDYRVIGVRTTLFYENGDYASFRKIAENDTLIENVNWFHGGINVSLYYEVLFKLHKIILGIYAASGPTFWNKNWLAWPTNYSISLSHKRMTYFAQWQFFGEYYGASVSAGITYQIQYNLK